MAHPCIFGYCFRVELKIILIAKPLFQTQVATSDAGRFKAYLSLTSG